MARENQAQRELRARVKEISLRVLLKHNRWPKATVIFFYAQRTAHCMMCKHSLCATGI
jgi:hypothetical protein